MILEGERLPILLKEEIKMTKFYIDRYNHYIANGKNDPVANRLAVLDEYAHDIRGYMSTLDGHYATLKLPMGPAMTYVLFDREILDEGMPNEEVAEIISEFDEEHGLKASFDVFEHKSIGDYNGKMIIVERIDRSNFRAWLA